MALALRIAARILGRSTESRSRGARRTTMRAPTARTQKMTMHGTSQLAQALDCLQYLWAGW